jgi:hypothetical protein
VCPTSAGSTLHRPAFGDLTRLRSLLHASNVGGEEVDAVAVEVAPGAVVVLGGAWVGVAGEDLRVTKRDAGKAGYKLEAVWHGRFVAQSTARVLKPPPPAGSVVRHDGPQQLNQRGPVHRIALIDLNGARRSVPMPLIDDASRVRDRWVVQE